MSGLGVADWRPTRRTPPRGLKRLPTIPPDPEAYRFLVASMERFASRPEFEEGARRAGFGAVRGATLFPGVCGMVTAVRS